MRALVSAYDDALRPSGLRSTQFSMLGVIRAFGPLSSKKLGELMVIDKTTLARSVALLFREGLIQAGKGADRREKLLSLTEEGSTRFRRAYPLWKSVQSRILRGAGRPAIDDLTRHLAAVVEATKEGGSHGK
jgi:DNA-binding MarR family transcriptional regulator